MLQDQAFRLQAEESLDLDPFRDQVEHCFDAEQGESEPADLEVCLQSSRGVAGLLHIIHNASNDLGSCMEHYDQIVEDMGALSSFLRSRDCKERLIAKCFSSGPAGQSEVRSKIEAFNAECYRPRWGTVARCAIELHHVLPALRLGWSREAYLAGSSIQSRGVNVETVDKLVHCPWFESYLLMLKTFSAIVLHLIHWVESCPCHWHLLTGASAHLLSKTDRHLLEQCPMRTRRAPELAQGDFLKELTSFSSHSGSEFLRKFPVDLEESQQASIIREFEHGRAYLTMVLMLKTAHFRSQPWSAAGLAYHDQERAREVWSAFRARLDTDSGEAASLRRQLPQLVTPEVLRQGDNWYCGADLDSCPDFAEAVSCLALIPIAERRVESQHARTQKGSKKSPHHSPAYMSLQLRGREISEQMCGDPKEFVSKLAPCVFQCRSYRKAAQAVNLNRHPAIVNGSGNSRDRVVRDAIYRADTASLHQPMPDVFVRDNHTRPPRAALPAEVLADSRAGHLVHQLSLEHLSARLQDIQKSGNDGSGSVVFGLPYDRAAFSLLREHVLPSQSHLPVVTRVQEQEFSGSLVESSSRPSVTDVDVFFQSARMMPGNQHVQMIFFKLLPSMHRMKRFQAEGEHRFDATDLPIAIMRPVQADLQAREVYLDSELMSLRSAVPGMSVADVPCVISLRSATLPQLKLMSVLKSDPESRFLFRRCPELLRVNESADPSLLHGVLKQICARGRAGLPDASSFSPNEKEVLESLQQCGMLTADTPIQLTDRGQELLVMATRVSEPEPLLSVGDGPVQERSRWQLLQGLLDSGWVLRLASGRACREAPSFVHGEGGKILYLQQSETNHNVVCSRHYLLALTLADEHRLAVPHGRTNAQYSRILSGLEALPLALRQEAPARHFRPLRDGDDWLDAEVAPRPPKRARRRRAAQADSGPGNQAAVEAGHPDDGGGVFLPDEAGFAAVDLMQHDRDRDGDDDGVDDAEFQALSMEEQIQVLLAEIDSDNGGVLSDAAVEPDSAGSSSSNGSSSSSSSSSTGESSSSSSSSSSASSSSQEVRPAAGVAVAVAKAKAKARAKQPPRAGVGVLLPSTMFWRGCRITEKRSGAGQPAHGLEASCRHPEHEGEKCRRTLKFDRHGGRDLTLKKLKWWLLQASLYRTKDEHVRVCPYTWDGDEPGDDELEATAFGY